MYVFNGASMLSFSVFSACSSAVLHGKHRSILARNTKYERPKAYLCVVREELEDAFHNRK
jgi:hypothetical protein